MANPDTHPGEGTLRSRAEGLAQQDAAVRGSLEPLSPEANQLLLHELRVHQIELEMQNEELRRAQAELDAARARYFDLYDLAPVGYCTLSKEGLILEANLTATTLLGVARSAMVKQPLSRFIHPEDLDLFYLHRHRLLEAGDPLAWDIRMVRKDGTAFWGHLEAGVVQDAKGEEVIRLVLSDVTERVWTARAQAFLAKAEWLSNGEGFFPALARFLAEDLGMDYVCIDRLAGDCLEAETLAIWCDGHFEDNVSYTLKDTPCGDVVGKAIYCFPSGVRHLFPKDQVLQDLTAESYVGVTLWGADRQPIGLIALIGRHPMADTDLAKSTLDLVALRAAAELDRHQADLALRVSEERYRLINDASLDQLYSYDLDNRFTSANRVLCANLGRSVDEVVGKSYWELGFPESLCREWDELHRQVYALGSRVEVLSTPMPDGTVRHFEVNLHLIHDGAGVVTGIAGVNRDITERKRDEAALLESNQRIQLATESAHLAVWDWDLQAGTMVWDDRMFELYGKTRLEINGTVQDWKDGLHPEDLERAVTECEAAIKGEAPFDADFRIRRQDGTILWIKANAKVLRDQEGNPVRMVGINRDITELKTADEERAKFQAQLLQSQKMESLGTLAGGVAHDMNNVLGAILGLASAHIGSQPYGSPLHQALDTICKATERGGKMVKSLLGFARQSPAENNRLDMNAILREQIGFLERTTLASVRLQIELEAELRPIQGDANALAHAFMNLCVNAVDAMPENGTLTLHTRNVDNDWIEVVVEDTGMGMPKEVLGKAMEPFFTTKEVGKGTGLGLSMVFSTVKAHRGQMAIESEPGKGTRVMLRFPACEQDAPIQAVTIAATEDTQLPHGTMKVLLIDDDDLIQSSVQAILEVLGHTAVNTAQSGEEALAILEAGFEPDLVILDMNMPGLGGIGTLPRLRALRPAVPVLLATGRVDQTALTLASAHPGVTLLSKPFGLRELQKHLESIGLG